MTPEPPSFEVMSSPDMKTVEQTATCIYCEAHVAFLIEAADSEPEDARAGWTLPWPLPGPAIHRTDVRGQLTPFL